MKIFTHRKIIFIFLLAIFLPLLIVGYLSLSTFSKRREAIKKLLESNLWISGEAGLKSIEGTLLELEQKALKSENFISIMLAKKADLTFIGSNQFPKDIPGQLFLLDADYQLIFPATGSENALVIQWEKEISNSQFAEFFQSAELSEFSQKNYIHAAELFKKCILSALSGQNRASAFEGLGRCLLSAKKYDEAEKAYNELSKNYGQLRNKAGHPYGIIASFQLYEIARAKKNEENCLKILLSLYENIQEGILAD